MKNNKLETISNLFEGSEIRSVWDSEKEEYYFSVVDVITVLTNSNVPKRYWSDLKRKLTEEGSQLYENIVQLKMKANDGKMRETDTLDTKGILRLIESIPSPKAEPFKLWLAQTGNDRINEVFDPELAKKHKPFGLEQNKEIAKRGGNIAKNTRNNLEQELGESVISNKNALSYKYLDSNKLDKKKLPKGKDNK